MAPPTTLFVVVSQIWDDDYTIEGVREPEVYTTKKQANAAGRKLMYRYAELLDPLGDPEDWEYSHQLDNEGFYRGKIGELDGGPGGHVAAQVFIYKVGLNQASTRRTAKRIPDDDDAKPSEDKNEDEDDETDGDDDDDDEDGDGDGDVDMDVPQPKRSAATTKRKETPVSHSAPKPKVLRKTIPVGLPDCLDGVKLLFTGTFETMDRVTSIATAKKYGADVVTKLEDTDYIVTGQRIGPKKAKIINELELETIDEQEFFYILENGVSEDKRQRMANKRSADEAEAPEVEKKPKATAGRKRARR